jgi:acetolactate synthase small subunit
MSIGKPNTEKVQTKEQTVLPVQNEYETTAIIKTMNVFDAKTEKYTTEINQKTVKVETFVRDLKTEKPQTIGYISVATIERFLNGEVKAIPIKMKRN